MKVCDCSNITCYHCGEHIHIDNFSHICAKCIEEADEAYQETLK